MKNKGRKDVGYKIEMRYAKLWRIKVLMMRIKQKHRHRIFDGIENKNFRI